MIWLSLLTTRRDILSVQKLSEGGYKVRWREMGKHRARTFAHRRAAETFDAAVKRQQRLGEAGIHDYARQTLSELHADWIERHVEVNLAAATQASYGTMWKTHIEPRIGNAKLSELTPDSLE